MRLTSSVNVFETTVRVHVRDRHMSPRVADDDVGLADVAEELAERFPAPRVVAVDHHDVIERGRLDAAAVRPAEAHVPLVDSSRTRGNARRLAVTSAPVPSVLPSSMTRISCAMSSGSSARVTFSSVARIFSLSQYAGITTESDRWAVNGRPVSYHGGCAVQGARLDAEAARCAPRAAAGRGGAPRRERQRRARGLTYVKQMFYTIV